MLARETLRELTRAYERTPDLITEPCDLTRGFHGLDSTKAAPASGGRFVFVCLQSDGARRFRPHIRPRCGDHGRTGSSVHNSYPRIAPQVVPPSVEGVVNRPGRLRTPYAAGP